MGRLLSSLAHHPSTPALPGKHRHLPAHTQVPEASLPAAPLYLITQQCAAVVLHLCCLAALHLLQLIHTAGAGGRRRRLISLFGHLAAGSRGGKRGPAWAATVLIPSIEQLQGGGLQRAARTRRGSMRAGPHRICMGLTTRRPPGQAARARRSRCR